MERDRRLPEHGIPPEPPTVDSAHAAAAAALPSPRTDVGTIPGFFASAERAPSTSGIFERGSGSSGGVVERTGSTSLYTPRWARGAAGAPVPPSAMASAAAAATAAASASASAAAAAAAAAAVPGSDPTTPSGPLTAPLDVSFTSTNPPTPLGLQQGFPGFRPRDPEHDRRNLSMEMPEPPPRRRTRPVSSAIYPRPHPVVSPGDGAAHRGMGSDLSGDARLWSPSQHLQRGRMPEAAFPSYRPGDSGILRGGRRPGGPMSGQFPGPGMGKSGMIGQSGLIGQSGMFPPPSAIPQSGSWGGTAPNTPSIPKSNIVQKSMIMCMDPTCNKCPPEMHALRNRKLMAAAIDEFPQPLASKDGRGGGRRGSDGAGDGGGDGGGRGGGGLDDFEYDFDEFDFEDDEEYDEETGGKRTIIRCCGLPCFVFTSRPAVARQAPVAYAGGKRRSPMLGFFRFVEGLVQPVGILNPHSRFVTQLEQVVHFDVHLWLLYRPMVPPVLSLPLSVPPCFPRPPLPTAPLPRFVAQWNKWSMVACIFGCCINPWFPLSCPVLFVAQWNKWFMVTCIFGFCIDPWFLFTLLTMFSPSKVTLCLDINYPAAITLTVMRSIVDLMYLINIFIQFRMAYFAPAPSNRSYRWSCLRWWYAETSQLEPGDMETDTRVIAMRYLKSWFLVDLVSTFPIPQIFILGIVPALGKSLPTAANTWIAVLMPLPLCIQNIFILGIVPALGKSVATAANTWIAVLTLLALCIQNVPRAARFFPLLAGTAPHVTGFVFETAWANFLLNLVFYLMASNFVGGVWYILAVDVILLPRAARFFPLLAGTAPHVTGFVFETAWANFLLNLVFYLMASKFVGGVWYILAVDVSACRPLPSPSFSCCRAVGVSASPNPSCLPAAGGHGVHVTDLRFSECLQNVCANTKGCNPTYLYCANTNAPVTTVASADLFSPQYSNTNVTTCLYTPGDDKTTQSPIPYGVFANAIPLTASRDVVSNYLYSFFWGLQVSLSVFPWFCWGLQVSLSLVLTTAIEQVSTLCGNLVPSRWDVEVLFVIVVTIIGLLLLALLIGNISNYLQSLNRRSFEYQLQRQDIDSSFESFEYQLQGHDIDSWMQSFEYQLQRHDIDSWMQRRNLPVDLQNGRRFEAWNRQSCWAPFTCNPLDFVDFVDFVDNPLDSPSPRHRQVQAQLRLQWAATRGVDEAELLDSFSDSIQIDLRRSLCLELLQCVSSPGVARSSYPSSQHPSPSSFPPSRPLSATSSPPTQQSVLFCAMEPPVLDAFCARLQQQIYTAGSMIIREGYPVTRIFFVLRGELESSMASPHSPSPHSPSKLFCAMEPPVLDAFCARLQQQIYTAGSMIIREGYPSKLFCAMEPPVLDAFCARLQQQIYTAGSMIIREGYPVSRIFFVLRGELESFSTFGGHTGMVDTVVLGKGDFLGEELLVECLERLSTASGKGSGRSLTMRRCQDVSMILSLHGKGRGKGRMEGAHGDGGYSGAGQGGLSGGGASGGGVSREAVCCQREGLGAIDYHEPISANISQPSISATPSLTSSANLSQPSVDVLPTAQRSVRCLGPVEGYSLEAADVASVCKQFARMLCTNTIQRALNEICYNRRTHAARTIQLAFRREEGATLLVEPGRLTAMATVPASHVVRARGASSVPSSRSRESTVPFFRQSAASGWRKLAASASIAMFLLSSSPIPALAYVAAPPRTLSQDEIATVRLFKETTPSVVNITNLGVGRDALTLDVLAVPQGSGSGFIWDEMGHIVKDVAVPQATTSPSTSFPPPHFIYLWHARTCVVVVVVGCDEDKDVAVLRINSQSLPSLHSPHHFHSFYVPSTLRHRVTLSDSSVHAAVVVGCDEDKDMAVVTLSDSSVHAAVVVGCDEDKDVAVLQIDAPQESLHPFGLDHTLTSGVISGLRREIQSAATGRPIQGISGIVEQIIENGRVVRPVLGISFAPEEAVEKLGVDGVLVLDAPPSGPAGKAEAVKLGIDGVVVLDAPPSGPAGKAGLRPTSRDNYGRLVLGDIITAIDNHKVRSGTDLYRALDDCQVGDTVRFARPPASVRAGLQKIEKNDVFMGVYQGSLYAELDHVDGADKMSDGYAYMAIYKKGDDYNIRYGAEAESKEPGEPTAFTINSAADNSLVIDLGAGQTYKNTTYELRVFKFLQKFVPYSYRFKGKWTPASSVTVAAGPLKDTVDAMIQNPKNYYAIFNTATNPAGCAKGAFDFIQPWWKRL
ncbi:unnamed protein product [Closterium sp. NIES-64]|nr:unnamed protein product [Closterium sp. NIES-64]